MPGATRRRPLVSLIPRLVPRLNPVHVPPWWRSNSVIWVGAAFVIVFSLALIADRGQSGRPTESVAVSTSDALPEREAWRPADLATDAPSYSPISTPTVAPVALADPPSDAPTYATNNAPTQASRLTSERVPGSLAIDTVKQYYALWNAADYRTMYPLLSSLFRKTHPYDKYAVAHSFTDHISIEATPGDLPSVVHIRLESTDHDKDGHTSRSAFVGTWYLVAEGNSWKLDHEEIREERLAGPVKAAPPQHEPPQAPQPFRPPATLIRAPETEQQEVPVASQPAPETSCAVPYQQSRVSERVEALRPADLPLGVGGSADVRVSLDENGLVIDAVIWDESVKTSLPAGYPSIRAAILTAARQSTYFPLIQACKKMPSTAGYYGGIGLR